MKTKKTSILFTSNNQDSLETAISTVFKALRDDFPARTVVKPSRKVNGTLMHTVAVVCDDLTKDDVAAFARIDFTKNVDVRLSFTN